MEEHVTLKFNIEFEHEQTKYLAYIIPVVELTAEERKLHSIRESSFLVHLLECDRFISFELFIGEDLEWQTTASSFLVENDLLGIIGEYIDRKFM